MTDDPCYNSPASPDRIDENDVHDALAFLIAIEPEPDDDDIDTDEDYVAYIAPFQTDIDRAMTTLRRFAEQRQPQTLSEMQRTYYEVTSDDRYLDTSATSSVVIAALRDAWDGVGPWRK
jgi:negative regulator of genetic competence, sporulation and motility